MALHTYSFCTPDKLSADRPFTERMEMLHDIFLECKGDIVVLDGAGVSTGSGIPDFRSPDGLYNNMDAKYTKYTPMDLLRHSCYVHKPQRFYTFYKSLFDLRKIKPCFVHEILARLEHKGFIKGIVTQNVDSLHEKAGSKNVVKIHGSADSYSCVRCKQKFDDEWFFSQPELMPRCTCGGLVRPDVVLYDENIPTDAWEKAKALTRDARCLLIMGTSLEVSDSSFLVENHRGRYRVIMNKQATSFDHTADLCFQEDIKDVLAGLDLSESR